jgi:hypothetical protein
VHKDNQSKTRLEAAGFFNSLTAGISILANCPQQHSAQSGANFPDFSRPFFQGVNGHGLKTQRLRYRAEHSAKLSANRGRSEKRKGKSRFFIFNSRKTSN